MTAQTVPPSHDIEEMEHALREHEATLTSIFRAAPTGIGLVKDRRLLKVNDRVCEMTGYSREELLNQSARMLYPTEEDYEYVGREKYRQIQEHGTGTVETRWQRKDGTVIHVLLSSTPLDLDDLGAGVTFTALDITERTLAQEKILELNRTLEQRVRDRTRELEALNKELESFAYSVSHDLRAPLRGMNGFSTLLSEEYGDRLDATGRVYIERIRSSADRMERLIEGILSLSRATRCELRMQQVNLSAIAEELLDEFRNTDPTRTVEFSTAPDLLVSGDPQLLRVALANLLGNAWKFTGTRTVAQIECGVLPPRDDGELHTDKPRVYFIRDNGVGFDMRYATKLFTAFQRLHKTSDFPGTGIGLATVKRIIRRHGGKIWFDSEEDVGTTVFFTLG